MGAATISISYLVRWYASGTHGYQMEDIYTISVEMDGKLSRKIILFVAPGRWWQQTELSNIQHYTLKLNITPLRRTVERYIATLNSSCYLSIVFTWIKVAFFINIRQLSLKLETQNRTTDNYQPKWRDFPSRTVPVLHLG